MIHLDKWWFIPWIFPSCLNKIRALSERKKRQWLSDKQTIHLPDGPKPPWCSCSSSAMTSSFQKQGLFHPEHISLRFYAPPHHSGLCSNCLSCEIPPKHPGKSLQVKLSGTRAGRKQHSNKVLQGMLNKAITYKGGARYRKTRAGQPSMLERTRKWRQRNLCGQKLCPWP